MPGSYELYMAALDFQLNKYIHLMPNVQYVRYDAPDDPAGTRPEDDLFLKLTVELKL